MGGVCQPKPSSWWFYGPSLGVDSGQTEYKLSKILRLGGTFPFHSQSDSSFQISILIVLMFMLLLLKPPFA